MLQPCPNCDGAGVIFDHMAFEGGEQFPLLECSRCAPLERDIEPEPGHDQGHQ